MRKKLAKEMTKVRKFWKRSPATKIRISGKIYSRKKENKHEKKT